jgi:hypothetical protein
MKKLFIAIFACLPMLSMAQNVWERPQDEQKQVKEQQAKKAEKKAVANAEDAKYLAGAVPVVDGKVVFTYNLDVPGKSAQEIYDRMYAFLDNMTKEENQFKESCIALVNKRDHVIAARFKEWLVFTNNFISLDRTEFNYTIIATCTDGHLNVTVERINYSYEEGRSTELQTSAEKWITDEYALNKKKTKLSKISGKFRRKTVDRIEYIFKSMASDQKQ